MLEVTLVRQLENVIVRQIEDMMFNDGHLCKMVLR
jgi:hypothetical protein